MPKSSALNLCPWSESFRARTRNRKPRSRHPSHTKPPGGGTSAITHTDGSQGFLKLLYITRQLWTEVRRLRPCWALYAAAAPWPATPRSPPARWLQIATPSSLHRAQGTGYCCFTLFPRVPLPALSPSGLSAGERCNVAGRALLAGLGEGLNQPRARSGEGRSPQASPTSLLARTSQLRPAVAHTASSQRTLITSIKRT